jgi:hypothetical protein
MKNLTIILEDSRNALAKISGLLAEAEVNIEEIDAEEVENTSVMHLTIADDTTDKAYETLRDAGYQVMPQNVLLVRVEDKPGGLAKLAVLLMEAKVNVRSMRIVKREDGECLCAIVPEPFEIAKAVLADKVVAG